MKNKKNWDLANRDGSSPQATFTEEIRPRRVWRLDGGRCPGCGGYCMAQTMRRSLGARGSARLPKRRHGDRGVVCGDRGGVAVWTRRSVSDLTRQGCLVAFNIDDLSCDTML
ncbi:hypothetical protein M6B38_261860 [Iris pallida]|uniref:Uncharacterized protein n=1 Tax=Iris pallida TaxID=29817 RepID=A0AAX6ICN0_IRIPA|nr:hypothetical protein M6B38_261860 [Iris pallida]